MLCKMLVVLFTKMQKMHFSKSYTNLLVLEVYSNLALVFHRTKMSKGTLAAPFSLTRLNYIPLRGARMTNKKLKNSNP